MITDKHNKAQILSAKASDAKSEGRAEEALQLYAQAAQWEKIALSEVPLEKVRTRSILSVSVASLFYKAELLEQSERTIFLFLASKNLDDWAEQQLRDLLSVVTDEKVLLTTLGRRYSGENIIFTMRGGEIGSGTGPLDLVLEKASGFRSLLYRFTEWIGKFPLRVHGNPPKEIMDLIQARATEPAFGSYQLEIKLTEPSQLELFESNRVRSQEVSDAMFQFLNCLTQKYDYNKINELVPQDDYRKALLQLTKNVAPGGKRIKEIGIYRKRDEKIQSIYLTETLPIRIRQVLPRRPMVSTEEETSVRGVLRALHLDKKWLELGLPEGGRVRCDTLPDMLDDVVGPMVNREVIVRGHKRVKNNVDRLLVEEIELADEG